MERSSGSGRLESAYHGRWKGRARWIAPSSVVLMAIGAAVVVFLVLAEPIGVTFGDGGFGGVEAVGFLVGIVAFVAGLAVAFVERGGETRTPLPH
jgi:hypothetical protein